MKKHLISNNKCKRHSAQSLLETYRGNVKSTVNNSDQ